MTSAWWCHLTGNSTPSKPKPVKSEPRTPSSEGPSAKKVITANFAVLTGKLRAFIVMVTNWPPPFDHQVKKSESVHSNGQPKSQLLEARNDKVCFNEALMLDHYNTRKTLSWLIFYTWTKSSFWVPADAAGHLQRGQALPARFRAGLWQTAEVLCGVWRRPRSRLRRRVSHAHASWTRRGRPRPESVPGLDLGVYPEEACHTALLTTNKYTLKLLSGHFFNFDKIQLILFWVTSWLGRFCNFCFWKCS